MATRLRFNPTRTVPEAGPLGQYNATNAPNADLTRAASTQTTSQIDWDDRALWDAIEPAGEAKFARPSPANTGPVEWWSERVAAEVAISGAVTFQIRVNVTSFVGKLRAHIYKITAGGSAVRTLIATGTSTEFSAGGNKTITATPASAVTVVRGERFIVIVSAVDHNDTGTLQIQISTIDSGTCWLDLTETVTFLDNVVQLQLRRTADNAIGDFFDALPLPRGSSTATTGVVATEAGATEVQLTREVAEAFTAIDISAAAIADTANATTYASASFTPVANRLYLLAVTHSDAAPETTVPTVATTTGLNFVQVGSSIVFDTIASNLHRLTLFRAMKASGLSAGTYTVTLADAGTGCCARLTEVAGVVTTGTDGADAVINISTNNANAGANPSVTLAAFSDVDNGTYACFASDIATVPTVGSGFSTLGHSTIGTPTKGVFAEWKATNDTTADCTLASSDWAGIAVELVQAAPITPVLLEWITGRVKEPFSIFSLDQFSGRVYAHESDALANCALRIKLFHRAPDGTETLVITADRTLELGLTSGTTPWGPADPNSTETLNQAMHFHEDDRAVLRPYIINIGTMAAGHTVTLTYDHNAANVSGDSYFALNGAITFKAEGEPDGSDVVPGGMILGGVSNGA